MARSGVSGERANLAAAQAGCSSIREAPLQSWHPVLAAVEHEPGVWTLTAQTGPYALVRLLEIGPERGYRVTTYMEPRQLVGYYRTLRAACEAGHRRYLDSHGPASSTVGYPAHLK